MRRKPGGGLLIALVLAGFALVKYCNTGQRNAVTGKVDRVSMSVSDEIALGLHSRDQMIQQFGGLYPDRQVQGLIDQIGNKLVQYGDARLTDYQFDFHVLNDPKTINAFALPGGQIFITTALLNQLETEDQVAGVLGHEIGHVIERHGAERIAKQELINGLTGAAVVASGDYSSQGAIQMIGNLISMKYGRQDELESDDWGIKYMMQAGYNPNDMKGVMEVLKKAGGGKSQPEFMSTHPDPGNRAARIDDSIEKWAKALSQQR